MSVQSQMPAAEYSHFFKNVSLVSGNQEYNSETVTVDKYPDEVPDRRCVHIRGLPRTGKSYYGISQMGKNENGIYISQNHAVIEQQFKNFAKLFPDKTAVHLLGKSRACNRIIDGITGNCKNCPLMPTSNSDRRTEASEDRNELQVVARSIVEKHRQVSVACIPDNYCKYRVLRACEEIVEYVFTVPQFIESIKHRRLAVMDEDPTFSYFYPRSLEIFSVAYKNDGSFRFENAISDSIVERFQKVRQDVEKELKSNSSTTDPEILYAVMGLALGIESIYEITSGYEREAENKIETIIERLESVDFAVLNRDAKLISELPDSQKDQVLEYFSRKDLVYQAEPTMTSIVEPFIFPALQPYSLQGQNPRHCYAVADERKLMFRPNCAEQYLFIGFNAARWFMEDFEPDYSQRITIDNHSFAYHDNFVFLLLEGRDKDGKESAHAADERMQKIIATYMSENRKSVTDSDIIKPALILTSSKSNQTKIRNQYHDQIFDARKEGVDQIVSQWAMGKTIIFYQNSVISRGVDIPFEDVIFVDRCGFAQPFYRAMIDYYKRENGNHESDVRIEQYSRMISEIITDETTNSILRLTPVPTRGEEQVKFVVMRECDFRYVSQDLAVNIRTIRIPTEFPLGPVVDILRRAVTTVRPSIVTKRGGGTEMAERTYFSADEIQSSNPIKSIHYGMNYVDARSLIDRLELQCADKKYYSQKQPPKKDDMIKRIAKSMLSHPSFNRKRTDSQLSRSIRSDKLCNWVKGRLKKGCSEDNLEKALAYIIERKLVIAGVISESKTAPQRKRKKPKPIYVLRREMLLIDY